MPVTRELLYQEVWAESLTKVAARYGVSPSFLARVCDRLNVPRPSSGYWTKLQVGKAPPKPELPEALPGDEVEWANDVEPRRLPRARPRPTAGATRVPRRASDHRPSRHGVLVGAREHFEQAKVLDSGYLRPAKKRIVDVFVTKGTLDRALDLANTLFLALEERGHRVTFADLKEPLHRPDVERCHGGTHHCSYINWRPDRPPVVYVGAVAIGLTLFELSEECEARYGDGEWVRLTDLPASQRKARAGPLADFWTSKHDMPTGRLCLRASSPYQLATWERRWPEEKAGDLAGKAPQIVRELGAAATTIAALVAEGEREAAIAHKRWLAEREEWLREEAEKRRAQNTKQSRDELFGIIERWAVAKQVEAFFVDAQGQAAELGEAEGNALRDRLNRARELLGGTDALARFRAWKAPHER